MTFVTASDNPGNYGSSPTRTVTWVLNDGSGSNNLSTAATTTVSVTAINDAPTLGGATPTVAFTEGNTVTLSGAISVSDADSLNLAGATVSIAGGTFPADGDVLGFSTAGTSVTASYNSTTETLTLSGASDTSAWGPQFRDEGDENMLSPLDLGGGHLVLARRSADVRELHH